MNFHPSCTKLFESVGILGVRVEEIKSAMSIRATIQTALAYLLFYKKKECESLLPNQTKEAYQKTCLKNYY
jgi:hypothetical protein